MLNLPHFRIDYHDFLRGNNSYVNYPDGGFSSASYGINIFNTPGLLGTSGSKTEAVHGTLSAADPVIAWGVGPASTGLGAIVVALGVNSSNDGSYYSVADNGDMTISGSADSTQDYNGPGFSDIVQYNSKWYVTSRIDMIECSLDLATKDLTFWTTTKGNGSLNSFSPHPMVVYNNILWIADKNYLHKLDGATDTAQAFDLPAGWVITSMCVYNNLIYMAAEPYWNASGYYHGQGKIFTWNGYSDSWLDEYDVDTRVNAMYVYDGILYCFTQYYLGYFDGTKIKYIRPLGSPVYKQQITKVDNSMFYADGINIIRYGSPVPGTNKVFVNFLPSSSSAGISAILAHYQKQIIMVEKGASQGIPYLVSNINSLGGSGVSYQYTLNQRFFSRPVRLRHIVVETASGLSSGQTVEADYADHNQTQHDAAFFGYGSVEFGSGALQGKNIYRFDVDDEIVTRTITPVITITKDVLLRYVDYYYEPSEDTINN